jgi:hypothetical protein
VIIFTLVALAFCWWFGEQGVVTKSVLTLLVLASFGLLATEHRYLFNVAQCAMVAVIGASTFGVGWLNQQVR